VPQPSTQPPRRIAVGHGSALWTSKGPHDAWAAPVESPVSSVHAWIPASPPRTQLALEDPGAHAPDEDPPCDPPDEAAPDEDPPDEAAPDEDPPDEAAPDEEPPDEEPLPPPDPGPPPPLEHAVPDTMTATMTRDAVPRFIRTLPRPAP